MRMLLMADIHIGSIKDTSYVYQTITEIIEKEVILKHTDVVVILGDYFHKVLKGNDEYVACAINVMSYLVRACLRSRTKIRIVYGTESHEMNQYRLFNYHLTSSDIDLKVFDTVHEEEIDGKRILYIPEEYIHSKHHHYQKYLYSDKHYDYIFGHGVIVEGMPNVVSHSDSKNDEKHVPHFKSGELSSVSDLTVFGHYHIKTDLDGNVHYLGSLFRNSFGEEEPKGYGIIEDDQYTFIENDKAYIYKTYEFNEDSDIFKSSDNLLRHINKIKAENIEIFTNKRVGKIRILFNPPTDVDPTFKENLRSILFNDKYISPMIKDHQEELISDIKDDEEVDTEWDFLLDNSLQVIDKMQRFIDKQYNVHMSLETLMSYLGDIFKK